MFRTMRLALAVRLAIAFSLNGLVAGQNSVKDCVDGIIADVSSELNYDVIRDHLETVFKGSYEEFSKSTESAGGGLGLTYGAVGAQIGAQFTDAQTGYEALKQEWLKDEDRFVGRLVVSFAARVPPEAWRSYRHCLDTISCDAGLSMSLHDGGEGVAVLRVDYRAKPGWTDSVQVTLTVLNGKLENDEDGRFVLRSWHPRSVKVMRRQLESGALPPLSVYADTDQGPIFSDLPRVAPPLKNWSLRHETKYVRFEGKSLDRKPDGLEATIQISRIRPAPLGTPEGVTVYRSGCIAVVASEAIPCTMLDAEPLQDQDYWPHDHPRIGFDLNGNAVLKLSFAATPEQLPDGAESGVIVFSIYDHVTGEGADPSYPVLIALSDIPLKN